MKKAASALPFYLIFSLSGFTGLVYESLWSRYLGLFLGHAAFAQTFVLSVFMGGLAIGAWICGRRSSSWRRPLRGYAVAEAAIGLAALLFPALFDLVVAVALDDLFPVLKAGWAVGAVKWSLSALLILPQSVLLGATFPLLAAGLLRRGTEGSGSMLATLYFVNSAGAALGAVTTGFFLVDQLGLPGTMWLAGVANLLLAGVVWTLAGPAPDSLPAREIEVPDPERRPSLALTLLLTVALATGAASLIYEVAWVRMLTLLLGSSARAFELMLGSFIAGLALGGLWIRRRIEGLRDPIAFLAGIQLAMGLAALATLPLYGQSFELVRWLMETLPKTEAGYRQLDLARGLISAAIMLPPTFCAGTTLPLVTEILLRRGHGERSIGEVYGWNTFGSIVGVVLAVHVGLPWLGVRALISAGAGIDILAGVALVFAFGPGRRARWLVPLAAAAYLALLVATPLDSYRMASGVYRFGDLLDPSRDELIFHRDGKTATVSLTRGEDRSLAIRTNGKSDATLGPREGPESLDEHTMILTGALPLAHHGGRPRSAAVVGFGSGLTTHTLLASSSLERVDTVEIEPLMVEGARYFGKAVGRAWNDPRSHLYLEDARTFFASRSQRYDLIVSEPSNPWVRGVSTLFTREFYRRVRRSLAADGLFAQWLQYYELDLELVVSVFKALAAELGDFEVYVVAPGDLLILARAEGRVPELDEQLFEEPELAELLRRIGIRQPAEVRLRWLANRRALEPFLAAHPASANTDRRPTLEHRADRMRFLGVTARELFDPENVVVPVFEMLGRAPAPAPSRAPIRGNANYERTLMAELAEMMLRYHRGDEWRWPHFGIPVPEAVRVQAGLARRAVFDCHREMSLDDWFEGMHKNLAVRILPFVAADDLEPLWDHLDTPFCRRPLRPLQLAFLELWAAVARRDATTMSRASRRIFAIMPELPPALHRYSLSVGMLGDLTRGQRAAARELWRQHSPSLGSADRSSLRTRVLLAHAFASEKR